MTLIFAAGWSFPEWIQNKDGGCATLITKMCRNVGRRFFRLTAQKVQGDRFKIMGFKT